MNILCHSHQDIAVFTNNATRCQFYRENSENVKGRHECVIDRRVLIKNQKDPQLIIPNNEEDCKVNVLQNINETCVHNRRALS